MKSQRSSLVLLRMPFAFLFFALILTVVVNDLRSSTTAQSSDERQFEDKIPKHLPIKIRIQPEKEKAAKDLNNDRWQHDLAFEVKNTGDKPIYYLWFILDLPEIKPNGINIAIILRFGKHSIFDESKGRAQPGDVPLRPNETLIFSIDKRQADGWDETRKVENLPQPKKLSIELVELNFGDGTGFWGGTGAAWPNSVTVPSNEGTTTLREASFNERRCTHVESRKVPKGQLSAWFGGESAIFWPTNFRFVKSLSSSEDAAEDARVVQTAANTSISPRILQIIAIAVLRMDYLMPMRLTALNRAVYARL